MSWYTAPPAKYVILRLGEKSPAFSNCGVKPSDVKNQLIGTRVSLLKPFNEIVYHSASSQKDYSFTVVEVSLGNKSKNGSNPARSETAVISRMTQVFLSNSNQNGVFCLSPDPKDWFLDSPYSEDDSALALRLHDPSTVRCIIGDYPYPYFSHSSILQILYYLMHITFLKLKEHQFIQARSVPTLERPVTMNVAPLCRLFSD
jgi:hypothetical protein